MTSKFDHDLLSYATDGLYYITYGLNDTEICANLFQNLCKNDKVIAPTRSGLVDQQTR